ncbi:phage portal protein [Alloyangia pacifica]|uniref:Phage portal protein, HK97 family n=1 Tax=Alloyangia pacifica TaxID=311180 RepID=A0A1I6QJ72_9RHOB|nr:phage portal protein [Alloyangia pacifica]SDF91180.1 phage portal protein, HK97 family [Alloyangia pacifica]SFS52506.1 phage portal protein, HK97 family [Alloyangia pacifica]
MGLMNLLRRSEPEAPAEAIAEHEAETQSQVRAMAGEMAQFSGLTDPQFYEFLRQGGGAMTESGATVTVKAAMRNTTVLRCVSLISFSIGMLPLHLQRKDDKSAAKDHPLDRLLHRRPNAWQTAFEFKSLMEQRALQHGSAFARIVRSGSRILQLIPIDPERVVVKQNADWTLRYEYRRDDGSNLTLQQKDVFHLRNGLSEDGLTGLAMVKQAAEAIGLAQQAERAAARLFRNGMIVGGALKHKGQLSPEAYERLKESMNEDRGAGGAHNWKILEEGMELQTVSQSGRDSQTIENRSHQIEEISRAFGGVPRPLLVMGDTSWGTGIDALGQLFVRYSLNPWFQAWEQAIERDLLSDEDAEVYEAKFNAGALLRGSMKDQADFFAKALGAGGHQPWMLWQEVRETMDLHELEQAPPPPPGLVGKGES